MPTKLANVQVHPQFRHRLRELRERAGLSLRALGALSNYSHSYLHDLERGVKQPTAGTAARLDGALSADGQLTTLVTSQLATLAPPAPPVVDARYGVDAGLRFAPDWHQGIDNATGLWRWNARGRGVLRDVGFSAALFITPVMRWLTSPSGEQPTGTGDQLVGPPDIDAIAGADGET